MFENYNTIMELFAAVAQAGKDGEDIGIVADAAWERYSEIFAEHFTAFLEA